MKLPNYMSPSPGPKVKRPYIALKGFKRVFVPRGETVKVAIPLEAEDLAFWNDIEKAFTLEKGRVEFFVGGSSADRRLVGQLETE